MSVKPPTKIVRLDLRYTDANALSYKDFCNSAHEIQRQIRNAKNTLSSRLYFDTLHIKKIECGCKRDGEKRGLQDGSSV